RNSTLYNDDVVNELINSIEVGTEMRFLKNRFGLDFTFYKTNAINQLMAIPMDPLSGYERKIINAGNIQNTGVELVLSGNILRSTDGLNWDMLFNISRNRNKIVKLAPEEKVTVYGLGGFDNVQIQAVEGENYGDIYGSTYKRVEDETSPYFGQLILTGEGLPQIGKEKTYLGNQQAKALLGWTNTLSYKNLSLSFLIDGRFGGEIFSGTRFQMQFAGTGAETVTNGERAKYVLEGVVEKEDGTFEVNTKEITPQQYWRTVPGNLGFTERNIYDATNIRLRNIQLNYMLPTTLTRKVGIQNAKVGFSINNVWMLKSNILGVDPESVFATGTNAIGFENLTAPTSRTYFINLAFNF
ncbi:MAG TPA: TonB-dependent receptor, partial [Saprospiraceae bacterium]|nr:TonB-dependent receptor [Saprospiraceae bacterium]